MVLEENKNKPQTYKDLLNNNHCHYNFMRLVCKCCVFSKYKSVWQTIALANPFYRIRPPEAPFLAQQADSGDVITVSKSHA